MKKSQVIFFKRVKHDPSSGTYYGRALGGRGRNVYYLCEEIVKRKLKRTPGVLRVEFSNQQFTEGKKGFRFTFFPEDANTGFALLRGRFDLIFASAGALLRKWYAEAVARNFEFKARKRPHQEEHQFFEVVGSRWVSGEQVFLLRDKETGQEWWSEDKLDDGVVGYVRFLEEAI